jgi:hypothetical protein
MSRLPKRPRQHTLETLSQQYVKSVLPAEWVVEGFENDYGLDLQVEIVRNEQVTGAHFAIQLKSTDRLTIRKKSYVSHSCETSTLRYFLERPELIVYLVYDAQKQVGYWLWIQDYIRQSLALGWQNQETVTIRIPKDNIFNKAAVRQLENRVLEAHSFERLATAIRTAEDDNFQYSLATGDRLMDLKHHGAIVGVSLGIHGRPVTIGVHAKHQDALSVAPINMHGTFRFDNSAEGEAARALLNRAFKAGEPAKFDARFFEGFGLPPVLTRVLSHLDEVQMQTVEILPITPDERFALKITVIDASGKEIGEIPYLECRLTQQGTEESTYANDSQGIPLSFQLVVNHVERSVTIRVQLRFMSESVFQVQMLLRLQHAFAKASSIKLTNVRTGVSLSHPIPTQLLPEADANFTKVIDELAFVQEKLNQPIIWPGEIGNMDLLVLQEVVTILQTGYLCRKASRFTISLPASMLRELASSYKLGEIFQLLMTSGGTTIELLGTQLELGNCHFSMPEVSWPEDSQPLRDRLLDLPEDEAVQVTFDIGEAGVQHTFEKWVPKAHSEDASETLDVVT